MPICPKCKNEYREGFTYCPDCKCDLVDSIEAERAEEETEIFEKDSLLNEEEAAAFLEEFAGSETSEAEEAPVRHKDGYKSGVYRNSAERAEDNKSSAWTLLSVGVIGIILLVLVMTGVIPLYFYGITKYLAFGVMSAMFILFIVMGTVSLRNSKIFEKKAESETTLSDTMKDWCLKNLKAEELDEKIFGEHADELTPEIKYFKRNEELKMLLTEKFMNLDEGFLEDFVDHIYEDIFGE